MLKDEEFLKYGKRMLPRMRIFLSNNSKIVFGPWPDVVVWHDFGQGTDALREDDIWAAACADG